MFEKAVEYIYSGCVSCLETEVVELLRTADRLGMCRLVNLCEQQLLQSLRPQNCLQLWQLGEDGNHINVHEAAVSAALKHFERLVQVWL